MAMTWRKVASGWLSWNTTVRSSGVVMPESSLASPATISSNPSICQKKPWPGLCVSGLTARSMEYLMSEATSSRPLWNVTPSRSTKV